MIADLMRSCVRRGLLSIALLIAGLPLLLPQLIAAEAPLAFESHILPIVQARCVECHNPKSPKAELDLTTRAGVLKGGESGAIVKPGQLEQSPLYEMLHAGLMPPEGKPRAKPEEIELIARWIREGAKFSAPAADEPAEVALSQHDIGPILSIRCTVCHGLRTREAGLDLRTKASMLKGGKSGPAIILGKPEESPLIVKMRSGAMPPNKRLQEVSVKPPSSDEIDKLARWIATGAPEIDVQPDVATTEPDLLVTEADRAFWSFQPPKHYQPPAARDPGRVHNAIDPFIQDKLQSVGLQLSPEAEKHALLRRASFDLTGLPPEPEEVVAFLASNDPLAYERAIDRLLASPRYGERWGRHWLDIAGYADSEGKRSQDPIRPFAFKYRDYVVRSLNADKPFDRFLTEQLAGDELADYEHAPEITQELLDNLIATGFLKMAPDGTGSNVVNFTNERLEVVADEMEVFGSAVLGLTIKCARCHTHKYDPIPQRDYYRLTDVFKGALDEHDWLKPSSVVAQSEGRAFGNRLLLYGLPEEHAEIAAHNARAQAEIDALKATREEKTDSEKRELDQKLRAIEGRKMSQPAIHALWDRGEPSPTYIYRRGDYLSPGRLVGPGVLSVLTDGKTPFAPQPPYPGAKSTGRRLALAKWLTQPEHPLTARVFVNRIWKQHFGQGIVKSLDNFGKTGTPPTHPELLDYLARRFVNDGWSIKSLHRLIMTSATYRQSSRWTPEIETRDPDNRWLSRMPLQRLDAESLRDALLLVAGKLDERRYGPSDDVKAEASGLMTPAAGSDGSFRRALYTRQRRKEIPTILETFDLPQMNPNCIERTESTVAAQALHLMNNDQVQALAVEMAERVASEAPGGVDKQIERLFLITVGRPPLEKERTASRAALEQFTFAWQNHLQKVNEAADARGDSTPAELKALGTFCHTLLNSAAFLYID